MPKKKLFKNIQYLDNSREALLGIFRKENIKTLGKKQMLNNIH